MSDPPAEQTPPDPAEPSATRGASSDHPPPQAAGDSLPNPGEPAAPVPANRSRPGRANLHSWNGVARGFFSVAAVIVLVALVVLARGGLRPSPAPGPPRPIPTTPSPVLPGLATTPAPWPPEYRHLAERVSALGLPDLSDTVFHIHAMLRVFVDGRPTAVPPDIGLPPKGNLLSPLHTHDASGIVHIESSRPYAFTLGQVFDIWGVVLTRTQLGGYHSTGGRTLGVYVNGRPVADAPAYVMHAHDTIIVGYGRPGSFPTSQPGDFSGGL